VASAIFGRRRRPRFEELEPAAVDDLPPSSRRPSTTSPLRAAGDRGAPLRAAGDRGAPLRARPRRGARGRRPAASSSRRPRRGARGPRPRAGGEELERIEAPPFEELEGGDPSRSSRPRPATSSRRRRRGARGRRPGRGAPPFLTLPHVAPTRLERGALGDDRGARGRSHPGTVGELLGALASSRRRRRSRPPSRSSRPAIAAELEPAATAPEHPAPLGGR